MDNIVGPIEQLIRNLTRLPGIGSKTAQRLAYHIIDMDKVEVEELANSIGTIKSKVKKCSLCCNISDTDPCNICQDNNRDKSTICVVQYPKDVDAMERTHTYKGLYHVLNGFISPLKGRTESDINFVELIKRVENNKEIKEIIIASSPTVDGDITASFLVEALKAFDLKVTRIGYGLPVGRDLEYYDEITISAALKNRRELI